MVGVEVTVIGWFVSSVIGKLIDKALSYYEDEKSWQSGMKKELENLSKSKTQIDAVIYEAERGYLRRNPNPALQKWLGQLQDATEEADNLLDELEYRRLKEEAETDGGKGKGKGMKRIIKFAMRATQHDDLLKRLREIVKTLDDLVTRLSTLPQVLTTVGGHIATEERGATGRETTSSFPEKKFFGREEEIEKLIDWLKSSDTKTISVFSIVGVGGVGKTALAQNLFNHQKLEEFFPNKMWVYVSNTFDEKVIIHKMLESLTGTKQEFYTLEAAQMTLKEKLRDQKFLIVFDDVWNDKEREKWENLMAPLANAKGCQGSKILMTTRMVSVADMVAKVFDETKPPLKLSGLKESDYLLLFERYAFHGFGLNDYPKLRSIGKEIAMKLRGIPLAIKAIGVVLNDNLEEEYWDRVLKDKTLETLESDEGSVGVMAAITLSYELLPSDLKPCFRYCAMFPPDYKFYGDELILRWISVGLVPEDKNGQKLFESLVRKSFFEPVGDYNWYIMHDVLHELAYILSANECLQVVSNNPIEIPSSIRHLSIKTSDILVLKKLPKLKFLRSFSLECSIEHDELAGTINTTLKGFKNVRYLQLSWNNDIPESVGDLLHLRCFKIDTTNIRLFQCVYELYHLQILELRCYTRCLEGIILHGICKLSKLKIIEPSQVLLKVSYIGKLTSLEKLTPYSVKGDAGYGISELEMMSELRELKLTNLENVKSPEEACKAKLNSKRHLSRIELIWSDGFEIVGGRNGSDKKIVDCLQPPSNLKHLSLGGYMGTELPNWLQALTLPNLTKIELAHCSYVERLPPFGQFLYLKSLILEDMKALIKIGSEFYGSGNTFPSLERLELRSLIHLEEWKEDTESEKWFPCLKKLMVTNCPSLQELPPIPTCLEEFFLSSAGIARLPGFSRQNMGSSTNQGLFRNPELLSSLQELSIENCDELVHLPSDGFGKLIRLKRLSIKGCSRIFLLPVFLPKNFFPPSLEEVTLESCGDLAACLTQLLPGLSLICNLTLKNCAKLRSLPSAEVLQSLTSLKMLFIKSCPGLKLLGGLQALPSLKRLEIRGCPMLKNEPQLDSIGESSIALDKLVIDCPELLSVVPLKNLHRTMSVYISGCDSMTALPEEWLLQNGAFLQKLWLFPLRSLQSLPDSLQSLTSLWRLALYVVPMLTTLPPLPRSLVILRIIGCSEELAQRCRAGGLDYDKVRHIDSVDVCT